MNQHSTSGMKRTAKDVINKAKNLQRLGKPAITWPRNQTALINLKLLIYTSRRRYDHKNLQCSIFFTAFRLGIVNVWDISRLIDLITRPYFPVFTDPGQKDEINKKAYEKFRKEYTSVPPTVDNAVPSERFDGECHDVKIYFSITSQNLQVTNGVKFQLLGATATPLPGPRRNKSF